MSDRAKFNTWHYNIDDTINSINNNISNLATKEAADIANVNSDIANVRKEHAADVSNINNDITNINTELDEVVHFNDPTSLIVLDKLEGAIEKSSVDAGTTYEKNGSSISTSGAKNSDIITIDATSTIINQHNAANTTFTSTGIVFTDSAKKTHTVMYDDTTKAITDAINNIVATETANRTAAVNAANDNLNAEEKARLAATNAVNTALDTEAKTRLAATNAVNSALDTEAKARAAATNAVNAALDTESKARLAATNAVNSTINTVNANVNAANDARAAATNAINTALDTESKARLAATNAVNTALDTESKARAAATNATNTALDTESKVRSAATDAINSTINAVNANLDSANNARLAATNAINTALDTESKARLAATNAINSSLTAETNARTAAVNAVNNVLNTTNFVLYTLDGTKKNEVIAAASGVVDMSLMLSESAEAAVMVEADNIDIAAANDDATQYSDVIVKKGDIELCSYNNKYASKINVDSVGASLWAKDADKNGSYLVCDFSRVHAGARTSAGSNWNTFVLDDSGFNTDCLTVVQSTAAAKTTTWTPSKFIGVSIEKTTGTTNDIYVDALCGKFANNDNDSWTSFNAISSYGTTGCTLWVPTGQSVPTSGSLQFTLYSSAIVYLGENETAKECSAKSTVTFSFTAADLSTRSGNYYVKIKILPNQSNYIGTITMMAAGVGATTEMGAAGLSVALTNNNKFVVDSNSILGKASSITLSNGTSSEISFNSSKITLKANDGILINTEVGSGTYDSEEWTFTLQDGKTKVVREMLTCGSFTKK